ncbi:hypothetical protein, partial [Blautia sp. MSK.21.1]|uniref:hypothetical protein n=1 Tax=Blautia sp. MSK.21.1 TaxID=2742763 RepID=UPI001A9ACA91
SGHVRDLHPLERAHGAQTQKKTEIFSFRPLIQDSPGIQSFTYLAPAASASVSAIPMPKMLFSVSITRTGICHSKCD